MSRRSITNVAGSARLPVEVVVAHVHEGGVGIEGQPVARVLVGAQHDLEVVAGTEPELRRGHLGGDVGAAALGRAELDLQHELLARTHATGDPVGARLPSMQARRATWSTFGPPHWYTGSLLRKNAGCAGSL